MIILIFFIILQITDGLFTLHGINAIGIDNYESNSILTFYMHRFGAAETLLAAKIVASSLGYFLYWRKMLNALWFVNGFYLCNLYHQIMIFTYYSS